MAYIKEIFTSIQGEGPLVGYKQLFVRFCKCNLHCRYCDTNFDITGAKNYSVRELVDICDKNTDCHSISFTGGEPLMECDFIKDFASYSKLPIYLETNGTLPEMLLKIIDSVTYISADIKLESCTGQNTDWQLQDEFFKIASRKELFAKAVFDEAITDKEIQMMTSLCDKYKTELILQPKMLGNKLSPSSECIINTLNKSLSYYKKVRVIPQTHKFINVD